MNWPLIGWIVIGLAGVLLTVLSWGIRIKVPAPRKTGFIRRYLASCATVMEQGKRQQIILGERMRSGTYPGLGLTGLSALPSLLTPETLNDGSQSVSASSGSLTVLARQIIEGRYADGFSDQLLPSRVETSVYGLTPYSFAAGLLTELNYTPLGNLLYLGDFGPESALIVNRAANLGGHVFAIAGSLAAQAALFLCVEDLMLGEEAFLLTPSLAPTPRNRASLLVEDVLRVGLIVLLVAGAILKMCGVL